MVAAITKQNAHQRRRQHGKWWTWSSSRRSLESLKLPEGPVDLAMSAARRGGRGGAGRTSEACMGQ